jgi:hypothetical protein
MSKKLKIMFFVFTVLFGIFVFIYGGYDNSPGAQLLGLIIFIIGITRLIKKMRIKK